MSENLTCFALPNKYIYFLLETAYTFLSPVRVYVVQQITTVYYFTNQCCKFYVLRLPYTINCLIQNISLIRLKFDFVAFHLFIF